MSGFFGIASKEDCVFNLFFGTDYHSHLGARRAGMAVYSRGKGFDRAIHNIENAPFRTKFEKDANNMKGRFGIGCISDYEPQPLIIRSHHGTYAIMTVGKINNTQSIVKKIFKNGHSHFLEMSGGDINATELCAAIINQKDHFVEGIRYAQEIIEGSMTIAIMTPKGIYVARDRMGRTPVSIGYKKDAYCISFESFAYLNLGFITERELGPGEIVVVTPESAETLHAPGKEMKICTFMWIYYGYSSSSYEGIGVEEVRYRCGKSLAKQDNIVADNVVGVPDSGVAHAIGYSNASGIPFSRPLIKYTPTWPRSFLSTMQKQRELIARMKMIPVRELIRDKTLLIIDDSIVRGTQLRETTEFLKQMGAKAIHVRPACPPLLFSCKYLNFSRSSSELELITRRVISEIEKENKYVDLAVYTNPDREEYQQMVNLISQKLQFDSLKYHRLDDMLAAVGLEEEKLCTYCWSGKE
ncbi:MAG: amidophosphoribosyltransferase [Lachnospiraceae bacterium]|nr:amidophosphoribosyltransferase [Lachnospiraceae bacterium]